MTMVIIMARKEPLALHSSRRGADKRGLRLGSGSMLLIRLRRFDRQTRFASIR